MNTKKLKKLFEASIDKYSDTKKMDTIYQNNTTKMSKENRIWNYIACIIIAIITITWVATFLYLLSWLIFPYGWWSAVVLVLLGMWILNAIYSILALPSLLMFLFKDRGRNLNCSISVIYTVGLAVSIIIPWSVIWYYNYLNIPCCIIAVIQNILLIIFYKRKIFELFEPD